MAGIPISTGSHPALLWPGINETWGQTYSEHAEEHVDLYDVLDSDQAFERDVQITPFGLAPIKPEGGGFTYDTELQGPTTTYQHISYALGYMVTYEEQINNLYKEVSTRRAEANAYSVRQTVENVAAFLYNNAFVTTYFTTGDGQALISTAHTNTTGGTYSNALNPGVDLSEAALEDICVQIMGAQNDRGGLISIMPRSLHISRNEWFNANRILKSVLQSGGANNDINVLKATNAFPEGIKLNHYFTAAHPWFVRTTARHGMKMFWRVKPEFGQDNDFDTKNLKAATFFMMSVGCTEPRALFASNGP